MKKRHLPALILPLILGLGLMSLPAKFNQEMRNFLSQKALFINRIFHASKDSTRTKLQVPVENWLNLKKMELHQAGLLASSLAPFSVNQNEPNSTPYITAEVLFRTPSRWNSFVWISIGSSHSPIVKKNSPVLSGDSLIGVVEYVGKTSSSVRLITDSNLKPAVRVARGAYDRTLDYSLSVLQEAVDDDKLPFKSSDEKQAFMWMIHHLQQKLKCSTSLEFLAKGILQGQGDALWRAENMQLLGTGFNYDFKDQHGPSRDLRTGEAIDPLKEYSPITHAPLLQVGDLLVTSGMD
ncbi:MAG: hypothetical protein LLF94_09640, partial [Chlamydiales bacterium]|nr:hypothetical protein [Chlamydiales bacterium]